MEFQDFNFTISISQVQKTRLMMLIPGGRLPVSGECDDKETNNWTMIAGVMNLVITADEFRFSWDELIATQKDDIMLQIFFFGQFF